MRAFCRYRAWVFIPTLALAACATSSHVLVGTARPPISPDDVDVLMQAPAKFEEIAEVKASSGTSLKSEDAKLDEAIEGLRKEAARLGANAVVVVLDDPEESDAAAAPVVASAGKSTTGGEGTVGLGFGTPPSRTLFPEYLHGLAIYVPD